MKNLLLILSILLFVGCADAPQEQEQTEVPTVEQPVESPEEETPAEIVPNPQPEPEVEPEPEPDTTPDTPIEDPPPEIPVYKVDLSLFAYSIAGNKFYDGTNWIPTTYEKKAGPSTYMIGDEIHTLDESGNSIDMLYAPEQGDLIKKTMAGYVLCDVLPPQEAQSLGGMYKVYSQIYIYSGGLWKELEHWSQHQWECKEIIETNSGDILIKGALGGMHDLKGKTGIMAANQVGIFIHSKLDKTAKVITKEGTSDLVWEMNYFLSAKNWLELNGIYYSHNGYKYSYALGLELLSTAMNGWNVYPHPIETTWAEFPVLIPAGKGDQSIYWLECNTGTLIEYVPSIDQIKSQNRLYIGSGMRNDGLALAATLNPLKLGNFIYFTYLGKVIRFDLLDGSSMIILNSDYSIEGF